MLNYAPSRHTQEACDFFAEMASKYSGHDNVIYEICNEPVGADWNSDIKPYAETVIGTIRQFDDHALILVGTNTWSQDVDSVVGNTLDDGKEYKYKFYSLAAIIAVGYRTNSERATQFRVWATKVLEAFTKQGYVLDKSRLINGQIFDEDYFEHLIAEIQEIRASERRFYQKITDIYATAVDYDKNSVVTKEFYATVQNKMHYAVHGNTAAEVIVARADHNKEHMGLTSWKNAPDGKIVKTDVTIAKNYLAKEEITELNEIVTMYLDYATRQARRHIPMTMEDWKTKLDAFLRFNDADVLQDKGKVTAAIAKEFAESEFEKYRVIQDSLYQSDFDRLLNSVDDEI